MLQGMSKKEENDKLIEEWRYKEINMSCECSTDVHSMMKKKDKKAETQAILTRWIKFHICTMFSHVY